MRNLPLQISVDLSTVFALGPLVIFALLYARRAHTLARAEHPVPGWHQACFYAGLLTIAAALTGLGGGSEELLYVHMIEHLLGNLGPSDDDSSTRIGFSKRITHAA